MIFFFLKKHGARKIKDDNVIKCTSFGNPVSCVVQNLSMWLIWFRNPHHIYRCKSSLQAPSSSQKIRVMIVIHTF